MRTGSEMVRGLKENLQAKQAKQKKKEKKISRPSKSSTPWGRKLCGKTVEYVLMPANNDRRFCFIIS